MATILDSANFSSKIRGCEFWVFIIIIFGIIFNDAAAAKSLQSCPTLCDPIDGSPPGFPVPGILQARTLEWVAISFSNASKWKVKRKSVVSDSSWPHGCSLPGSSIHAIFQPRTLEWGAIAFSEYLMIDVYSLTVKQWQILTASSQNSWKWNSECHKPVKASSCSPLEHFYHHGKFYWTMMPQIPHQFTDVVIEILRNKNKTHPQPQHWYQG